MPCPSCGTEYSDWCFMCNLSGMLANETDLTLDQAFIKVLQLRDEMGLSNDIFQFE